MNSDDSAFPRPASALPTAATPSPARTSAFPSGRRRRPVAATTTAASVPDRVGEDRDDPGGKDGEVRLGLRDRAAGDRIGQRHRDRDSDREPDVEERQRSHPANADALQRAGAEERGGEEAAAEVVDAEGRVAPAVRRAPRDRPRARRRRRRARPPTRAGPGAGRCRCRRTRSALSRSASRVAAKASSASIGERVLPRAGTVGARRPPR